MKTLGTSTTFPDYPLAELHAHLGSSISPATLWQIAHDQGIKLPKRDYHEFKKHITLSLTHKQSLNAYLREIYHPLLDPLSSGTHAVERATYYTMAGAYRVAHINTIELRNNPMKHNAHSQFDLDHIIMAMLRGMERALLEYKGLNAGLIFCMAREFKIEENAIIIEKAIKYRKRGVVGIDVGGPADENFKFKDYKEIFDKAAEAGLGITVHTGEVKEADDMWDAIKYARPKRIGHGIRAAYDKELMKELVRRDIVLEVCPMSNLATKAVANMEEMKFILRTFIENNVKFCINTDWPEVIEGAQLRQQYGMLLEKNMLSEEELRKCTEIGHKASFIPKPGGLDAYLS